MGILLASSLGDKVLIGFIAFVIIYGICLGPKGKGGSRGGSRGGSKKDYGNHRNGVKTNDLHNNPANRMQGHGDKRGI